MSTVFYFVLNMSITAAVIGIIVLLIRGILGKWLPKLAVYTLWSLVLVRMVVPFSFGSNWSFLNSLKLINGEAVKLVPVPNPISKLSEPSTMNFLKAASEYHPMEYKSHWLKQVFTTASWVWVCGAVMMLVLSAAIYIVTVLRFREAALLMGKEDILHNCKAKLKIKDKVRVFTCSGLQSPVVIGIVRPKIIIPRDMDTSAFEYILLHELVHIKRKDNLWRILGCFAACIHWFNPLAWFFLQTSYKDAEMACDSRVLKPMEPAQRVEYAQVLAEFAVKENTPLTAFGGTAVHQRILNAVNFRRISAVMAASTAIFCIILTLVLISNPI